MEKEKFNEKLTQEELDYISNNADREFFEAIVENLDKLRKHIWLKISALSRKLKIIYGIIIIVFLSIIFIWLNWMISTEQFYRPISRRAFNDLKIEYIGYYSNKFREAQFGWGKYGPPTLKDLTHNKIVPYYFPNGNFTILTDKNEKAVILDIKRGKRFMKHPIPWK